MGLNMNAIDLLESPTNEPDYYTAEDYEDAEAVSWRNRYGTYLRTRGRYYIIDRPLLSLDEFIALSKKQQRMNDQCQKALAHIKLRWGIHSAAWDRAYRYWLREAQPIEWALCA